MSRHYAFGDKHTTEMKVFPFPKRSMISGALGEGERLVI